MDGLREPRIPIHSPRTQFTLRESELFEGPNLWSSRVCDSNVSTLQVTFLSPYLWVNGPLYFLKGLLCVINLTLIFLLILKQSVRTVPLFRCVTLLVFVCPYFVVSFPPSIVCGHTGMSFSRTGPPSTPSTRSGPLSPGTYISIP